MILLEFKKPLLLDRYSNSDARNLNFLQSYSETYRYQFPFKQEIWKLLPLKNASNFHTRMQQRNEKICKLFKAIWSSTHYNILALSRYMSINCDRIFRVATFFKLLSLLRMDNEGFYTRTFFSYWVFPTLFDRFVVSVRFSI